MTFDLKSASMHGEINHSRVRVLWRDGILRAFGIVGLLLELKTEKPVRMKGYLNSWLVKTDLGTLILKGKCVTCGGRKWWRIVYMPGDELWNTTW